MSALVRVLEEDIFQLCERVPDKQTALEKQRLYSRVGQFLMGSFDGHWWCHYPTLMTFMVRILELHPGPHSVRVFYDKMAQQLGICSKCVDIYQSAMPSVRVELENEFTRSSVKAFFHKVSQLDAERLQAVFALNAQTPTTSTTTFNLTISTAFYEILSNRRVWSDFRIIRVVSKWLASTPELIKDAAIDKNMILRSCPGIMQWLVSPDPGIRAWATSLVGKHGIVVDMSGESSDGRAWMKVLDEWMYILESGSFNTSLLDLDLPSTEELPMFLDVTNCVKTPTNQTLWAALDTVMQRMNETSLETLLESFDNLPDLVFNYLNDAEPATTNPQVTFVICKCYGSLMRCLGHRYWNHTVQSPKVVLDLILQHCLLPSWRVFVTKQLIDLLPALVASMRPPTKSTNERNQSKMSAYFAARNRVLKVLLHQDHRPAHFNDPVLCVSVSKAVSTIVCDCYEPRLSSTTPANGTNEAPKRDDGALPEMSLVDLSVIETSFWWPCGVGYEDIEQMWINHLFRLLVNPENVVALVDHVAVTCSTVLTKHLSLLREVVYTAIKANDTVGPLSIAIPSKPIITKMLERLCSWSSVATIPIAVHGALFESVGGISELLNMVETQPTPNQTLIDFKTTLKKYESLVIGGYLERISDEVLVKGLTNPLRFPVVAQHLTVCLLSPNSEADQRVKRLLAQAGANKATPDRIPPPLESLLVVVHRNTEAYLRGILNLLQGWRLYHFSLTVVLPTVKKVIFTWTKIFEMLGNDLMKAMELSSELSTAKSQDEVSKTVNLQKVPVLIGDFLVRLLSDLYSSPRPLAVEESILIQSLDFGIVFWRFLTKADKESAFSKRYEGMIAPLTRCVESIGGQAEKRRAAELLMTLLEGFVQGQTRVDDASLSKLEAIKPATTANIESKKSTDFARMANKLRQVSKLSRFFSPRPIKARHGSRSNPLDLSGNDPSLTRDSDGKRQPETTGTSRPMSGKSAAREQARLAAARSAASTIFETSAKKNHSFYDEDDFSAPRPGSTKSTSGAVRRTTFNISDVMKGMEQARPGARQTVSQSDGQKMPNQEVKDEEEEEDEKEDEDTTNLAPVFFKIKNTQKAIPSSTLVPFFRHLLQVCMPALLTKEFDTQDSSRELVSPPLTFSKSSEYANVFLPLLLEECHNEIQEGLRQYYFSSGKAGHLLRYEAEKPREGMRCMTFSVVESSGPSSAKSRPGDKFFRREKLFRNADVVLLRSVANSQNSGNLDFIGVVVVSENDKERRRQGRSSSVGPGGQGGKADQPKDEQEFIRIMFLNDGELESVTSEIPTFQMEALTAVAIADTEWRVMTLSNLVTSSREYIALRSVDMLPEHFRTTILTPNVYETTQTELLKITTVLDELRVQKSGQVDINRKIVKLLKRLDKMEISLTDLRSTSIGKTVNKLRKHDNADVKMLSNTLKDKWTALMDKKDALDVAPRYVSAELWDTIKGQYNQSQLQSIHSVLNNYSAAISLLQGPPGTGKTKTIMGLLSGFLTLKIPPAAVIPQTVKVNAAAQEKPSETSRSGSTLEKGFSNFDLAREVAAKQAGSGSISGTFSLSGTPATSRILRHSDSGTTQKPTTIQALKNVGSVRSRLESKINGSRPSSAAIVRQTLLGPSVLSMRSREAASSSANVLLCAPSNGAVDELVLRIVTDGLLDRTGNVTQVRAPSVHLDARADGISIVRLGNPGEDAPDVVKAVCLPHIIKQELAVHPKTVELRNLLEQQRTCRTSIKDFYDKKQEDNSASGDDRDAQRNARRGLAKTHAELTQLTGRIRRLRDEVSGLEAKMTAAILSAASIIACTLSKAGSGQFEGLQRGFDALIVDEAAQAVELSTLIPIRERVARAVLVGDPKQLPATVKSVTAARARYDRSLFERIAESGVAPSMLRVQYRMHPFLREFPSKQFYGGMLTDGPTVMERVHRVCGDLYKNPYFQPFLLYDLIDTKESDSNGSKYNPLEAAFCVDLCSSLFEICPELRVKKWSVGFVSPYREQVGTIRKEINQCSRLPTSISVEVNTVDGFQGREKDIIIFSCVRASDRGGIGFLKDIRRLNVGITRARFCLFVVGSVRTLRRDETWNALVQSAEHRKLIIQAKASKGFSTVKEKLDRDERGLKAHYAEMHSKLSSKKAPTSTQQSATEASDTRTNGDQAAEVQHDNTAEEKTSSPKNPEVKEETKEASLDRIDTTRVKREHDSSATSQPVEKKTKVDETSSIKSNGLARNTTSTLATTSASGRANRTDISSGGSYRRNPSRWSRSRSRDRGERSTTDVRDGRDKGTKRPAPPLERDSVPSKKLLPSQDARRRSRSRSRSRPDPSLSSRDVLPGRERTPVENRERSSSANNERPLSGSRDRPASSRERPSSSNRDQPSSTSVVRPVSASRRDSDRQRSRSRDQSSSIARSQSGAKDTRAVTAPASLSSTTPDPNDFSRHPGVVREKERTAEQKHLERQARLRALRETADARAGITGPKTPSSARSGRIVQLVRTGSREGSNTNASSTDRSSGSLLNSILGSTRQLAKSTSRVDPANARRDHAS